jgi:hypothetical protein
VISSDNSARGEDRTFGSRFALCQYLQRGQPTKQLHAEEQDQQVIQLSNHIHPVEECNIGQVLITTLRTAAPRWNSRRGGVQLTRPWSWLMDRWRAGEQHLVGCGVGGNVNQMSLQYFINYNLKKGWWRRREQTRAFFNDVQQKERPRGRSIDKLRRRRSSSCPRDIAARAHTNNQYSVITAPESPRQTTRCRCS